MPRSRSSSIESRSCGRCLRGSTAPVTSRMRSARVDFPWSMWAMIEKLRMLDAGARMCGLILGTLEATADQLSYLPRLLELEQGHGSRVDDEPGHDAHSEADDLGDQAAAEGVVESVPDGIARAGERRGGHEDLDERRGDPASLDAAEL